MPDNDNDTIYQQLLEKLDNQQEQITNLEKKLNEVTAFNRQLLNRSTPISKSDNTDETAKKKLDEYIKED